MLKSELSEEGTSHWELDAGDFTPYKGPDPETKKTDRDGYTDSVLANSILLSDGNTEKPAVPVAEASVNFQTLLKKRFRLRRLYCDPKLKSKIDGIVKNALRSPQLDLPLSK